MDFTILRHITVMVLSVILLSFTSCGEDNDGILTTPSLENVEQNSDSHLPDVTPVSFEFEQTSEKAIAAQFEALAEKIASLENTPESMSELLLALGYDSKAAAQDFNLDAVIASYERGLADAEGATYSPVSAHLDAIFDIVGSSVYSPDYKYKKLQQYKSEFVSITHEGLSQDEANALLYEINLQSYLVKSLAGEFNNGKAGGALAEVIKIILEIFDISFITAESIFTDGGTCATAIISLAASMISCGTVFLGNPFGGFSCVLIPIKVNKAKKKCNKGNVVWTCEMSPDPCCGVNCIPGFKCSYPEGECVPDHENDPCQSCDADQVCMGGRCVNM